MSSIKKSLDEAFEIEVAEDITDFAQVESFSAPIPIIDQNQAIVPVRSHEDEDFEFARSNLRDLAEKGTKLLDTAIENAKSSDHPRHFEVAGQILKALADINKDILIIRKTHKESKNMKDDEKPVGPSTVINSENTVFVGTTKDLLKQIKAKNEQSNK